MKLFFLDDDNCRGYIEKQIVAAEKKLKIMFPEVLRKFYLKYGKTRKLNINDHLFRLKDVYIEEEKILIFGKTHYFTNYFGLNIKDINKKNPPVFEKVFKRDDGTGKRGYVWESKNFLLEDFLFKRIINDALSFDGFKYSLENDEDDEVSNGNIKLLKLNDCEKLFRMRNIKELSSGIVKTYTDRYESVLELFFNNKQKIFWINFGTERKDSYIKMYDKFIKLGIKIIKKNDKNKNEFQVLNKYIQGPIVEFFQGKYKFNPEHYTGDNPKRPRDSIFLHEDSVDKFHDILLEINKKFDIYAILTYYNKEKVALFVNKLESRLQEMKTNRKFSFPSGDMHLNYYSYHNVQYRRYKKQIISMFESLILWLKANNKKGISVLGI